jgi:eukaryotic-like serine/threonine-protein kinase
VPEIGQTISHYRIIEKIGAGGMGEVYRARDARLERDVAVKVLPAHLAEDPAALARFEREGKAIAALSHPNILGIFDVGSEGGVAYAVTELLEGKTLRSQLADGALPIRKATDIGVQIARGLAAAHDKGVVHRDLKPENVFLLRDGQVKILDFGLARQTPFSSGATETTAALSDPGVVIGTVGYMAPEQVRGQHINVRADLFALGAVLYEMLSGRRAFQRDTAAETLTAILREDPPDVSESSVSLPPALDRIARHCLEKSPAERFQTARDVGFALEALSGSGTTAVLATAPGRTRPRAVRWGLSATAGLLLVCLSFAAGSYWISRPTGLPVPWEGELLGGPMAGLNLRVSPSGQEIAFAAIVGKQAQVAKMNPTSGDWTLLTSDPARGNAQDFAWSSDSARLYFDRFQANQPSIFWISPLGGGQEKLLLPDAFSPRPLPDVEWRRQRTRIRIGEQ